MKTPYDYIVYTDKRYNNESPSGLILNTEITERDGEFVNRIGSVVAPPMVDLLGIPKGAKVIVHHNVFRRWYDVRGKEKNGSAFFNENHFVVNQDLIYGYNTGRGWVTTPRFVFIRPMEDRYGVLGERRAHKGEVAITNAEAPRKGEKIVFRPESEYAFDFDGEKLYRVFVRDICAKWM